MSIEFKFDKDFSKPSSDPWYDLTSVGYLVPDDMEYRGLLKDGQTRAAVNVSRGSEAVKEAILIAKQMDNYFCEKQAYTIEHPFRKRLRAFIENYDGSTTKDRERGTSKYSWKFHGSKIRIMDEQEITLCYIHAEGQRKEDAESAAIFICDALNQGPSQKLR